MISESILRIIDYNTADNDEKALVVSVLQLNEGEKLHQLLALVICTEGVKGFCEEHNVQLDDEHIPKFVGGSFGETNINHIQFHNSVSISGNLFNQYACENDKCECAQGYRNVLSQNSTFISCRMA